MIVPIGWSSADQSRETRGFGSDGPTLKSKWGPADRQVIEIGHVVGAILIPILKGAPQASYIQSVPISRRTESAEWEWRIFVAPIHAGSLGRKVIN